MSGTPGYRYSVSTKSGLSDELINTYLLRPIAGLLVRVLYSSPVTPNQVTVSAIAAGLVSAFCYLPGTPGLTAAAGLFLTLKDVLDSADGQLARAKNLFSRRGRFLDSIGDVVVNLCVFLAIAAALSRAGAPWPVFAASMAAFLSLTLRVSYHVFYQTSYLHRRNAYLLNRTSEEIRGEDLSADRVTIALQRTFLVLYGWQDALMAGIDAWSRNGKTVGDEAWYADPVGLRWSGFLGLGTELFLLMLFSLCNELEDYLAVNLLGMNAVWAGCILYRKRLGRGNGRDA
jgi:phosphatidylglycerophosphate synthase